MKRLGTIWPQSPNWPLSPKASDVASDANPTAPSNTEGMSVLSPTDLDAFLKLVESSKGSASVASPRLTLFNRERGLVKIEQEMSYISGYKQTPGSPPVPVVSVLETGISVPIHAEIFYDQKSVVTDFHFKATSLISFDHFSDPQKNFGLQIPRIDQSERAAVVVIPENLTLIVFGLPISGSLGLSEDVEHSKDPQNDANSTNKAGEAHYPVLCLRPKILRGENAPFTPTVSSTKPAK